MGNTAEYLLKSLFAVYPFEGGGNCTKAAVFHDYMLNQLKPAYDRLYPPVVTPATPVEGFVQSGPDDETPHESVVLTETNDQHLAE